MTWQRLLGKFAEEELAKAEKLLSLRRTYDERVVQAEEAAEAAVQAEEEEEQGEDEDEDEGGKPTADERIFLARME